MNDLNRLPLGVLMRVAKQTNLVDDCRKTEWVVVLEIDDEELVMNHTKPHIFLDSGVAKTSAVIGKTGPTESRRNYGAAGEGERP